MSTRSFGGRRSRVTYVASVVILYTTQVIAVHKASYPLIAAMLCVGGMAHGLEYYAVSRWAVADRRRGLWRAPGSRGPWTPVLFAVTLCLLSVFAARLWLYAFTVLSLLVATLHHGFDAVIWRSRSRIQALPLPSS